MSGRDLKIVPHTRNRMPGIRSVRYRSTAPGGSAESEGSTKVLEAVLSLVAARGQARAQRVHGAVLRACHRVGRAEGQLDEPDPRE